VTILCSVMKIGAPPPARAPDNFRSRAVKRPARLPAYTICGVRAGAQAADVSASSIGREGRVLSQGVVLRFCALGASSTQPKATLQRSTPSVERNARWFSQTPQKGCEGRRELSSATSEQSFAQKSVHKNPFRSFSTRIYRAYRKLALRCLSALIWLRWRFNDFRQLLTSVSARGEICSSE